MTSLIVVAVASVVTIVLFSGVRHTVKHPSVAPTARMHVRRRVAQTQARTRDLTTNPRVVETTTSKRVALRP